MYPPPERQPLRPVKGWRVRGASVAAGVLAVAGGVFVARHSSESRRAGSSPEVVDAASAENAGVADAEGAPLAAVVPSPVTTALRALGCDRATVIDLGGARQSGDAPDGAPTGAALGPDVIVACEVTTPAQRPDCDAVSAAYLASGSVPSGALGYVVTVAQRGAERPLCLARYSADGGPP